jgi:phosphomannomutase
MLTVQERSLAQIRTELPSCQPHKTYTVRCPWTVKGSLMRHLVETHANENLELVDGVKIVNYQNDTVLILPDAGEPLVHIYANSDITPEWVDENLRKYSCLCPGTLWNKTRAWKHQKQKLCCKAVLSILSLKIVTGCLQLRC